MARVDEWVCVEQAAAGVLGPEMAPSAALAERQYLSRYLGRLNLAQVGYDPREALGF